MADPNFSIDSLESRQLMSAGPHSDGFGHGPGDFHNGGVELHARPALAAPSTTTARLSSNDDRGRHGAHGGNSRGLPTLPTLPDDAGPQATADYAIAQTDLTAAQAALATVQADG